MRTGAARYLVALVLALAVVSADAAAQEPVNDPHYQPVKVVADREFGVGTARARYFGTMSLDGDARAERVFITIHGLLRDADVYEKTGEAFVAASGEQARVITPQFLTQIDVEGWMLPASTLRWDVETWLDGSPSKDAAHLSAFDVLDAIVSRLADRSRFPQLREIVVAGHSAGGQLVQRYAALGRVAKIDSAALPLVRFVVANPSSYLYFDGTRPEPRIAASCPGYNRWKYGVDDPPPYVGAQIAEGRYLSRRLTYLLGQRDIDPAHRVLDKSCMAEAQGAYRLARGRNYLAYLRARHPGATTQQSFAEVANVGHDGEATFTSPCGLAVLFARDRGVCAASGAL